jgi:mRNA interferase RelE/StbE
MYSVIVSKKAEKMLDKMPNMYYELISRHLLSLEQNPRPSGCKKLVGSENAYRIRTGIYRIVYTVKDDILTVEIIKIDHRSSVYR